MWHTRHTSLRRCTRGTQLSWRRRGWSGVWGGGWQRSRGVCQLPPRRRLLLYLAAALRDWCVAAASRARARCLAAASRTRCLAAASRCLAALVQPCPHGRDPVLVFGLYELVHAPGELPGDQGLTLVHFSAQLEPCLTQGNPLHTLNTPLPRALRPLRAPPIPYKALKLS